MKISWNWLKTLINIKLENPYDIAENLTLAGSEIESIKYETILGSKDIILDITSTPNRNDLLSVIGIAKEIELVCNLKHKLNNNIFFENDKNNKVIIKQNNNNITNKYYKSFISNINIKESPLLIQQRLIASGITPKNNIVDISNYIMIKWGCPLEVIDIANINEKSLDYNNINDFQESYISLDNFIPESNQTDIKNQNILTTTYKKNIIYISGINASENFKIKSDTKNIYLQSILYNQSSIRTNSQLLGTRTESSIRYERGINSEYLKSAYIEALSLIQQANLDSIQHSIITNDLDNYKINNIQLNYRKLQNILGPINSANNKEYLKESTITNIFNKLGFVVSQADNYCRIQPSLSRYNDITREADLIEEIARIYGFNKFIDKLPYIKSKIKLSNKELYLRQLRIRLRLLGFTEIVNYSLITHTEKKQITLKNPLTIEYNSLRSNLIEGLVEKIYYNYNQSNKYLQGFEIGRIFHRNNNKIIEKEYIGGILGGNLIKLSWTKNTEQMNWYFAKGKIETLLSTLQYKIIWEPLTKNIYEETTNLLHPGKTCIITINNQPLGIFGEVHPQVLKKFNLNTQIFAFEINLNLLLELFLRQQKYNTIKFQQYSIYPIITRDISIIIPLHISVELIINTIKIIIKNNHILKNVQFIDEYQGKNIPKETKSIVLRLQYQSRYKTLTTEEVDQLNERIKIDLNKCLPISIR
uniref:phenylalanyl-tRNA synthetase beta subunit n=1 Tax=Pulvinaster venetus TaxID=427767 RepID=UPI001FCD9CEE|nr:phenylalanyl-tRNA synthetase beta subunit [Pulvinaster venetus]UNJ16919.1 phenylalanyl-tRNA synthetase beta subunit [Pulvinaster venetus]